MGEVKGGEKMSERKVVGRNVSIALGIICIILAVGLVGAVVNYTSIIATKDFQIASSNSQITDKDNTISSLKKAQLHRVNVAWSDHHPWFSSPYISISGTVFNSGSETALNVRVAVRIYDSRGTLLKTEEILLGIIEGKSYKNFDMTIGYSGDADSVTTEITFDSQE